MFKEIITQIENNTPISEIISGQVDKFNNILSSELGFWQKVLDFIDGFGYMTYILLALGFIVALFGKKLLPLAKFFGFFAIGFVGGVLFLSPYITPNISFVKAWIVGLVIGLVAAIFCKIFYYLVVAGAAGGAVYYLCIYTQSGWLYNVTKFISESARPTLYAIIAAAVAVLIVLLLLKWIEMLGTAFLGSWLFVASLNTLTKFMELEFIKNFNNIVFWVIIGIVALIGFAVQVKTRKRY